jgi:transcriptional regulator with PAS, ATPase and Fis domain
MSPALQVKVLRVLQEGTFNRVGDTDTRAVDVRIIAATNRDLSAMVAAGQFREDLYYRIHVISVALPSLRDRRNDIPLLIDHFLARHRRSRPKKLAPDCAAQLAAYAWPGNVRELRNAMEHAIVVAEDDRIDEGDLPAIVRGQAAAPSGSTTGSAPPGPMKAMVEDAERRSIEDALAAEGGNQTRAAKRLGISRRWLIHKMERYGLGRPRKGG